MKTLRAHAIGTVLPSVSLISLPGTGYVQNAVDASIARYDRGRFFSCVCGMDYYLA